MNIPSEVLAAAETAYYSRVTHSEYDSYLVIAEWARKEALREALASIDAIEVFGTNPGLYEAAIEFAADCIRDMLADGATS